MHPQVRDLYKRLMFIGRDYPLGLNFVRKKAKGTHGQLQRGQAHLLPQTS